MALFETLGERWELNESLIGLANGHRFSGDKARGRERYLQGLDLMAAAGNRPAMAWLLFLVAAVEGEMGRHERVARLWGAAEAVREAAGAIRPPAAALVVVDPSARHGRPSVTRQSNAHLPRGERWIPRRWSRTPAPIPRFLSPSDPAGSRSVARE